MTISFPTSATAALALALVVPAQSAPPAALELPLDEGAVARWRPIRAGVARTATAAGLEVRYDRARGEPAGVAWAVQPGALRGLDRLELDIAGEGGALLLVSLRSRGGAVHSWPMRPITARGGSFTLAAADLRADARQSADPDAELDPALVEALTLVDVSAFLGGAPGEVRWTIRRLAAGLGPAAGGGDRTGGDRTGGDPAEQRFFAALVDGDGGPGDAIPPLLVAALRDPANPRLPLLLGLAHTWTAAESRRDDPRLIEHAMLAVAYFDRVAALDPGETRLPSWQVPIRVSLARLTGRIADLPRLVEPLYRALERDPGFHGFAAGLLGYGADPESAAFTRGLAAVRAAAAIEDDDPSVQNRPRWPHNVEGFLLFAADYEHRAGNGDRARALLDRIEAVEAFSSWPFRTEVEARRRRWTGGSPAKETPAGLWMQPVSCRICHRR